MYYYLKLELPSCTCCSFVQEVPNKVIYSYNSLYSPKLFQQFLPQYYFFSDKYAKYISMT